jgi:U3 small nucleolar RNA-associated protein 14
MPPLPINFRRVLVIAGILVLVFMVIDMNRRLETLNMLNKQAEIRSTQMEQAMQTQVALQTKVAYAASTSAVEEWARSVGLSQDGDQVVVPLGVPGSDPVSTVEPTPMPTPLPNWQVWWNLFFSE